MSDDRPCADCGICCMHMSSPPYDDDERDLLRENLPHVYADLLAVEESRRLQFASTGVDEVPCGFFDPVTRGCRHHGHHPDVCERFEVGGEFCNAFRGDVGLPLVELVASGW